jgi:hypothetical protein
LNGKPPAEEKNTLEEPIAATVVKSKSNLRPRDQKHIRRSGFKKGMAMGMYNILRSMCRSPEKHVQQVKVGAG